MRQPTLILSSNIPAGSGTQHATLVLQYMDHIHKKIGELHRLETVFCGSPNGKVLCVCNTKLVDPRKMWAP